MGTVMITLKRPRALVDLAYANSPLQIADYRARGYMRLEELRAMPDEIASLRRRIDDQIDLIASLRRQLGADHE